MFLLKENVKQILGIEFHATSLPCVISVVSCKTFLFP